MYDYWCKICLDNLLMYGFIGFMAYRQLWGYLMPTQSL